jgi:hypothetical protein
MALMALPLQYVPKGKGWLTVNLDNWKGVTVTLGPDKIHLTAADVFAALKETP